MSVANRDLEKEKYWLGIIDKYKGSGKSCSQFCKDEGVKADNFYYWRKILSKRQKEKNKIQPPENKVNIPFVPLSLPKDHDFSSWQNSTEQIEISKIVLRISANTDKSTLACILQSLEKS